MQLLETKLHEKNHTTKTSSKIIEYSITKNWQIEVGGERVVESSRPRDDGGGGSSGRRRKVTGSLDLIELQK